MLKLTKVGNALKVEGQNHPLFPNDGYLMLPLNSVIVVTDESDIVTFRSSSTNDVLFSGLVSDITIQGQSVTKENVCETFGSAFNVAGGGGEGGLTPEQEQRLNNAVQIADYNADKEAQATIDESQNTAIEGLSGDIEGKQDKIDDLDAIREGAEKGATAIQEETDPIWTAEKVDYYKTVEVDVLVGEAKTAASNAMSVAASAEGIASAAHSMADEALEELKNKADKSDYYDKEEIEFMFAQADATYQPKGDYATKGEVATEVGKKQDTLISGTTIKTVNGESILGSGNIEVHGGEGSAVDSVNGKTGVVVLTAEDLGAATTGDLEGKQDKIDDLDAIREGAEKGATALQEETDPVWESEKGNYYTRFETDGLVGYARHTAEDAYNAAQVASSVASDANSKADEALTTLEGKADKSEIPSLDGYATESWVEDKGYITEETDPTVPSHVKAITEEDIAKWNQGGYNVYQWEFYPYSYATENASFIFKKNGNQITVSEGYSLKYKRYSKTGTIDNTYQTASITSFIFDIPLTDDTIFIVGSLEEGGYTRLDFSFDVVSNIKGGGITEETDPTVPQYVKDITEADIEKWNNIGNVITKGDEAPEGNIGIGIFNGNGTEIHIGDPLYTNDLFYFRPLEVGETALVRGGDDAIQFTNSNNPLPNYTNGGNSKKKYIIYNQNMEVAEYIAKGEGGYVRYIGNEGVIEYSVIFTKVSNEKGVYIYDGTETPSKVATEKTLEDYVGVETYNQHITDQTAVDEAQNSAIEGIEGDITRIDSKIDDIELFKFPNATIIGEPTIQSGQVSDFSTENYLQFPFVLDLHNQSFQIDFCFTTSADVSGQQNVLDSKFGIALAVKDGKGLMAISSNGTSWNIGSVIGTMNIEPNTTYYARLTWDGIQYKTFLSTDGSIYTQDMVLVGAQRPFPTNIYIGGCDLSATGHEAHPFKGTINMNKAQLTVMGNVVWQGMDDAGLATRLATNLNNIDEVGKERIKEIVGTIPTKTSELVNDSGFLTEHQSLDEYAKTADIEANYQPKGDYATKDEIPSLDGYATEQWVGEQGYLTEHQPLKTINGETIVGDGDITFSSGGKTYVVNIYDIRNSCTFSIFNHTDNKWATDVTFSGDSVQYSTSGGQINNSLSFSGHNGTMIWENNSVTATILIRINGVWGISFTITRPNMLQQKLTSGTNIKTVNGESLLGSGNIEIQGGGGDETDPIWTAEKVNYYTKTEVDEMIGNINNALAKLING